jgi:hypothetical protein
VRPGIKADFAQQAGIARVGTERFNPRLDAEPRHAVGSLLDPLTKPPVGGVAVAEAHVCGADLVRAEILLAGDVLHTVDHLFCLVLQARDGQDDGLQRQDRRALIQSFGFLDIRYGFRIAAQLRVRDRLEGESKRRIRFEFQAPSRQFNRVVVTLREQQKARGDRIGSYRNGIEFDGSPDLPDGLVMSSLCGQMRRAMEARRVGLSSSARRSARSAAGPSQS